MSDNVIMKGSEFIKKVKKLAKERGIEAYVDKKRGKGSHVTLYFGENFTVLTLPSDRIAGILASLTFLAWAGLTTN